MRWHGLPRPHWLTPLHGLPPPHGHQRPHELPPRHSLPPQHGLPPPNGLPTPHGLLLLRGPPHGLPVPNGLPPTPWAAACPMRCRLPHALPQLYGEREATRERPWEESFMNLTALQGSMRALLRKRVAIAVTEG